MNPASSIYKKSVERKTRGSKIKLNVFRPNVVFTFKKIIMYSSEQLSLKVELSYTVIILSNVLTIQSPLASE